MLASYRKKLDKIIFIFVTICNNQLMSDLPSGHIQNLNRISSPPLVLVQYKIPSFASIVSVACWLVSQLPPFALPYSLFSAQQFRVTLQKQKSDHETSAQNPPRASQHTRSKSQRHCSSQQRPLHPVALCHSQTSSPAFPSSLLWFPKYIRHIWILDPFSCTPLCCALIPESFMAEGGPHVWVCPGQSWFEFIVLYDY